jgi:fucose permease
LFIIGCSLTAAQVLALPLLRQVVGAAKLAFHSTLNTCLYAIGAVGSPYLYTLIIRGISNPSTDFPYNLLHYLSTGSYAWAVVYWIFLIFFIMVVLIILVVKFPLIQLDQGEKIGNMESFKELLSNKKIYFYFFALFSYAACEQGNANWISQFLNTYHSIDPQTTGALVLSRHWLFFAFGCIMGIVLLKHFESRKILFWFTIAAMVSFVTAIFGNGNLATVSFPLVGLSHSVMWPIILALGMNSVKKHHGSLSGLLFAASTGGAFGVMMVGKLGDLFGLRWGFSFLMICYSIVGSVYFWSKPSTDNSN